MIAALIVLAVLVYAAGVVALLRAARSPLPPRRFAPPEEPGWRIGVQTNEGRSHVLVMAEQRVCPDCHATFGRPSLIREQRCDACVKLAFESQEKRDRDSQAEWLDGRSSKPGDGPRAA